MEGDHDKPTSGLQNVFGLLERALRDTDGTVALAAAYGLHRAKRDDLIDSNLAGRTDARANEIRRVLPILSGV